MFSLLPCLTSCNNNTVPAYVFEKEMVEYAEKYGNQELFNLDGYKKRTRDFYNQRGEYINTESYYILSEKENYEVLYDEILYRYLLYYPKENSYSLPNELQDGCIIVKDENEKSHMVEIRSRFYNPFTDKIDSISVIKEITD